MTDVIDQVLLSEKACALLVRGDLHDVDLVRARCLCVHGGPVIVHEAVPFDPYDVQVEWNLLSDARAALFDVLFVPDVSCLGADYVSRLELFEKLAALRIAVLTIGEAGVLPVTRRLLMSDAFGLLRGLRQANVPESLCV